MNISVQGNGNRGARTGKKLRDSNPKPLPKTYFGDPEQVLTVWFASEAKAQEFFDSLQDKRNKNPLVASSFFEGEVLGIDLKLLHAFRVEMGKPTAKVCAVDIELDRSLHLDRYGNVPECLVGQELRAYQALLTIIKQHGGQITNVAAVST